KASAIDWHVHLAAGPLNLVKGRRYALRFRARADRQRPIGWWVQRDEPNFASFGGQGQAALGTAWHRFRYVFTASDAVPDHARLVFALAQAPGTVWLADIVLAPEP